MRSPRRARCARTSKSGLLIALLAGALATSAGQVVAQDGPDDDAKFNAKAALISARLVYLTNQSYAGVSLKALKEKNPDLRFLDDAASTGPAVLSLKVVSPTQLRIAVYGIKTCWGVREEGKQSGVATLYAKRSGPATECKATSFKDGDFHEHEQVWKD
jgi:hypothetical protein